MFDPLQSAYIDKHSTETALIKVQNDILSALDAGSSANIIGGMVWHIFNCVYLKLGSG